MANISPSPRFTFASLLPCFYIYIPSLYFQIFSLTQSLSPKSLKSLFFSGRQLAYHTCSSWALKQIQMHVLPLQRLRGCGLGEGDMFAGLSQDTQVPLSGSQGQVTCLRNHLSVCNLDGILKSRDITQLTKGQIVKTLIFQESCTDVRVGP